MKTFILKLTLIFTLTLPSARSKEQINTSLPAIPESLTKPSSYLTPFEKMMRRQLKSSFRRQLHQRAEPTISFAEELVIWAGCAISLYALGRLKLNKKIMVPALALDSMLAYSQYPLYKSLGKYPSLEYVGFPSITLLCTIGLTALWKKARGSFEHQFFDEHKTMAEISQCAHKKELTSDDIQALENHFNNLKTELIERGMYKYLYLAGARVSDCFTNLEEMLHTGQAEDFRMVFKMIELTNALLAFAGT